MGCGGLFVDFVGCQGGHEQGGEFEGQEMGRPDHEGQKGSVIQQKLGVIYLKGKTFSDYGFEEFPSRPCEGSVMRSLSAGVSFGVFSFS